VIPKETTMAEQMNDPFEAFRKLWGPLGMPIPGMAMPTLDPAEIEKRVADLRSVETWLTLNLNMVKLSIQGLEVQRSALLAMKAAADNTTAAMRDMAQAAGAAGQQPPGQTADAGANPMLWPWAAMQAAAEKKEGGGGQGEG
jgi:hypothetical protein